ncbi:MAG: sulfatase, partial [Verrucomicrobiota bacterium]
DEDTLVVFAGDQGWMGGQNGFFGMGDHTRPIGAHDLMMQIPFLFRHPGTIIPSRSDLLVSNNDFLPSVRNHLDLGHRVPAEPESPGRSFAPVLYGYPIEWEIEMA